MSITDVLASVAILTGVALFVIASIGLHRFDDVYARMHVATKPSTLGLLLVLLGAGLRVQSGGDIAKLALVAALQLITAPMAAHIIGRAAHRAKVPMSHTMVTDDLAAAGDWPEAAGAYGPGTDDVEPGASGPNTDDGTDDPDEKNGLRSGSAGSQE
ncbi:MAG: monovalent cation/H(+) antiporter subunit G [Actinomycetota bacterium]|nr:monovalent cation/H(+) antiporter subunit G [Actinomycetota bacterium]